MGFWRTLWTHRKRQISEWCDAKLPSGLLARLRFWSVGMTLEGAVAAATFAGYAFMPDKLKEAIGIQAIPWWLWAIIALVIIIVCSYEGHYWKYADTKIELDGYKTPKFEVFFDANDSDCMRPFNQVIDNARPHLFITERKICFRLVNTSGKTIEDIDVYCEEAGVRSALPPSYEFRVPALGKNTRVAHPGEPVPVGLLIQTKAEDTNTSITHNYLSVWLPIKCQKSTFTGSDFFMKVLIVGKDIPLQRVTYRFGDDKEGNFIFKQEVQ